MKTCIAKNCKISQVILVVARALSIGILLFVVYLMIWK